MQSNSLSERREIDGWRREFSLAEGTIYLNHAAVSPLPLRVVSAINRALDEATPGADAIWMDRLAECERVRESAASLLGAGAARQVAFVPNTSTGLSYVAEGLAWRRGDNVVSAESEFPANVYPWLGLAERGVELRRVAEVEGRVPVESVERAMDARTRVVALSWVQYATGFRIDLAAVAELCRERDALLVVDAIQGLGALPLSVSESGVDVCVAGAHKWLMGGEGIGLLSISDRALERIRPVIRGWLGVKDVFGPARDPADYVPGAARFECGTGNVAGIYGLGAAIDLQLEIGTERIGRRVLALAGRLEDGLRGLGFELATERAPKAASGIVAAAHPRVTARTLFKQLAERDIQVTDRRDYLRIAAHFYNTEDEIDRCLDGIAELV